MKFRAALVLGLTLLPILSACGEDPFVFRWVLNPAEDEVFSLDRQERNRAAGFSMLDGRKIVIEAAESSGRWDFALDRADGRLYLLPPAVLGVINGAGIVEIPGVRYEDVIEAPSDTAQYVTNAPVPVNAGSVYVVRTHDQPGAFGERCSYYGRLVPVVIDVELGVFRFKHDTSPDCNNRSLIPPS